MTRQQEIANQALYAAALGRVESGMAYLEQLPWWRWRTRIGLKAIIYEARVELQALGSMYRAARQHEASSAAAAAKLNGAALSPESVAAQRQAARGGLQ